MRTRFVLTAAVVVASLLGACSGDDADSPSVSDAATSTSAPDPSSTSSSSADPTTAATSTTTDPTSTTASSTSTPSTVVTAESLTPTIERLIDAYDAVVAEILTDPGVAANPNGELVRRYLALFPADSAFATGALGFWTNEAAAGRFYEPGPRGTMYDSTVMSVDLRSETEAVAKVCTITSIQIVDSSGAALESQGGVNGGEVVVVRVGDEWLLRDLTEAPPDDCPRPGDS